MTHESDRPNFADKKQPTMASIRKRAQSPKVGFPREEILARLVDEKSATIVELERRLQDYMDGTARQQQRMTSMERAHAEFATEKHRVIQLLRDDNKLLADKLAQRDTQVRAYERSGMDYEERVQGIVVRKNVEISDLRSTAREQDIQIRKQAECLRFADSLLVKHIRAAELDAEQIARLQDRHEEVLKSLATLDDLLVEIGEEACKALLEAGAEIQRYKAEAGGVSAMIAQIDGLKQSLADMTKAHDYEAGRARTLQVQHGTQYDTIMKQYDTIMSMSAQIDRLKAEVERIASGCQHGVWLTGDDGAHLMVWGSKNAVALVEKRIAALTTTASLNSILQRDFDERGKILHGLNKEVDSLKIELAATYDKLGQMQYGRGIDISHTLRITDDGREMQVYGSRDAIRVLQGRGLEWSRLKDTIKNQRAHIDRYQRAAEASRAIVEGRA